MSTRLPLWQRRKIKTRESILSAATELFITQGFDNTTLDQIADRAEVHKQTILRYFSSKHDIAISRNNELLHIFERGLSDPNRTVDVLTFWREQITSELNLFKDKNSLVRAHSEMLLRTPALRSLFLDNQNRIDAMLIEALAVEAGADPKSDLYSISLGSTLVNSYRMVARKVLVGEIRKPLDKACLEVVDFIVSVFPPRDVAKQLVQEPSAPRARRTRET